MVEVGEHYRPVERDEGADGIYRVVGAGDRVALLRVADGDGRRVHSGVLRHASRLVIESEFEYVEDPDAGFDPARWTRNQLSGLYWSFRRFL